MGSTPTKPTLVDLASQNWQILSLFGAIIIGAIVVGLVSTLNPNVLSVSDINLFPPASHSVSARYPLIALFDFAVVPAFQLKLLQVNESLGTLPSRAFPITRTS